MTCLKSVNTGKLLELWFNNCDNNKEDVLSVSLGAVWRFALLSDNVLLQACHPSCPHVNFTLSAALVNTDILQSNFWRDCQMTSQTATTVVSVGCQFWVWHPEIAFKKQLQTFQSLPCLEQNNYLTLIFAQGTSDVTQDFTAHSLWSVPNVQFLSENQVHALWVQRQRHSYPGLSMCRGMIT